MMVIAMFCVVTGSVYAADKIIQTSIEKVTTKLDKNGNEYVQIIIKEGRELNGVKYKTDVVVMCFGSTADAAKDLKVGDPLKAVVAENEYRGRLNYNLVAVIQ